MFTVQNSPCEFAHYASGLNLSLVEDQKDLAIALDTSFTLISRCAAGAKNCMNHSTIGKLRKIVFDTKTHALALQPVPSALSEWLPTRTWTLLGYEEEAAGPENLEGMMVFIAEKLSKIGNLKFGSADEDTFTKYLLENYQSVNMGMSYLKEYYRRYVPSSSKEDNEEKTLERCIKIHETITLSAGLGAGYSPKEIQKLSGLGFSEKKIYDVLSLEINAPIKKMMSLGEKSYSGAYIKKVFERHVLFMLYCLKIDPELFSQILVPLSNILERAYDENQFHSSNYQLQEFYLQILNSEYFEELHMDAAVMLLEKKSWHETEEEFQSRNQSKPVKKALSYIYKKIDEIKKQPVLEKKKEQLGNFLMSIGQLRYFPPFKKIFDFSLVHFGEVHADNNPGLPFHALGGYHVNNFVTEALLSFDDLEAVDLSKSAYRKKLLECAEPIIIEKFSKALQSTAHSHPLVDLGKLNQWLILFPEIQELFCWALIENFCKANNLELPFS